MKITVFQQTYNNISSLLLLDTDVYKKDLFFADTVLTVTLLQTQFY